ncbi:MAG TPA: outer membrane lipoprotein chaperone LolA [Burkholderiaceae bacterium]|nr:outer membrane lipoprotein chaperone LolA [Burkholderiaceae bacterium]
MPKIRLRTKRWLLKQLANKLSHRRWLKHVLLAGLLGCLPLAASANDAQQQLQHFIENVHSATGEFRQQTFDARRNSATKSQSGTFAFKRPGLFKWHIDTPYEQLVLSDGKTVSQYDPDLEQVTQRPLETSMGSSPAAILFGSDSLEENFQLEALADDQGLSWLRATPKRDNAGFTHVDIGLDEQLPVQLLLLDAFGQTTKINLSNIKKNPQLNNTDFQFKPPANVDVITMGQDNQ